CARKLRSYFDYW
nr:immunoglobulin heavy chain junction region [Mus musculus]MBK4195458.1 immunoglobulin heavy chain junction region [Mus musculus]